MKKLAKLTLNEMQDFVPISPQEQMAMKGGMTPYQWFQLVYTAWKLAGEINEAMKGSGSPTSTGGGSTFLKIYKPDSVIMADGTKIYSPDSLYMGSGN